jgi:hypothetical protein
MSLACSACTHNERPAVGSCHHCGRPLCSDHVRVFRDPAFQNRPLQDATEQKGLGSRLSTLADSDRLTAVRLIFRLSERVLEWMKERNQSGGGVQALHCESCLRRHHGTSAVDKATAYST